VTRQEKKLTEARDELVRLLLLERFGPRPRGTTERPRPEYSPQTIAERRRVLIGNDERRQR
jgi:hypothetical protein